MVNWMNRAKILILKLNMCTITTLFKIGMEMVCILEEAKLCPIENQVSWTYLLKTMSSETIYDIGGGPPNVVNRLKTMSSWTIYDIGTGLAG